MPLATQLPELDLSGQTADADRVARLLGIPGAEELDNRTTDQLAPLDRWVRTRIRPHGAAR